MIRPLLILTLVLTAFTGASAQTPDDTTLVIAQGSDSSSLDPASLSSIAAANIARHLWGTLLEITPEGEIVPYLAESYEVSESGTEISFILRQGLTCQDGEALTAEDVVYTFERAADPENAFTGNTPGFIFDSLGYQGARVDGELTATILTDSYNAIAPGLLAEVYIHCKDSYEAMSLEKAAVNPVGSGPYGFREWLRDDRLVLQKASDFTLRDAKFETLVWRVIPEASTRAAELIAGNIDIADAIEPDQIETVESSDAASVQSVQGTQRVYVGFNLGDTFSAAEGGAAIQETAVRVALQYAVDVPTICETLLGTSCERATGLVNPPNDNPDLEPYPYDPDMAEQLLDEAGYPRGDDGVRFSLALQVPSGRAYTDSALAVGQYLSDIGVETKVELQDFSAVFVPNLIAHESGPLFVIGSGGATWSALYDMADIRTPDGATNYSEWSNPEWFSGWERLSQTRDEAAQREIINEMLTVFYNDPPWLMLYFQPNFYGVSERLTWEARRDGRIVVLNAHLK